MAKKREIKRVTKDEVRSKNIEQEIRRAIHQISSYKKKYPQEYDKVVNSMQAKPV